MVSIKDIAKEAGVTAATVSLALREHPRISKSRVEQVKGLARKMGYKPNFVARGLQKGKSKTIGYLASSLQLEVASRDVVILDEMLLEAGYKTYVSYTKGEMPLILKLANDLISHGVDGLVVTGIREGEVDYNDFNFSVPTVFLKPRVELPFQANYVRYDHYPAIKQGMQHMVDCGHRHIFLLVSGWVGWQDDSRAINFKRIQKELQLPVCDDSIYPICTKQYLIDKHFASVDQENTLKELDVFFKKHPECTALFCSNDITAMATIRGLAKLGMRVPEDVSVLGFDNITTSAFYQPALSTIGQPSRRLLEAALDLLFRQINGEKDVFETKLVTSDYIKRESITNVRS